VFDIRTNAVPVQRLQINAAGDWDVDAADYVHDSTGSTSITSVGSMTLSSSAKLSVLFASGSTWSMTADDAGPEVWDINVDNVGIGNAGLDIDVTASGGGTASVDITSADTFTINTATDNTSVAVKIYAGWNDIYLQTTDNSTNASGTGSIYLRTGDLDPGATGGAPGDINVKAGNGTFAGSGGGHVNIESGSATTGTAGDIDIDSHRNIEMDAVGGISLDALAASNFTVTGDTLSLTTVTSGSMIINSAENVTFTYNEAAAGSALYLVNDDTTVGTFSSSIALQALTDGDITLTVTDSLVTGPAITLDANGAAAAINLDSDYNLTNVFNNAAGAGSYSIYEDTTQILDIDSSGVVKWTPGGVFEIDTDVNSSTGYSLIDGVHFVNGKNTTAFATLLQGLSTGAHIVLGPGTHDISWTTAQTFNRDLKITGSGASTTAIRFTSNDADCCLNFTGVLELSDVTVTRSVSMTNQAYAIQMAAPGSIISDCVFETDAQAAPTWTSISVLAAAEDTVLRNIRFETNYSSYWHINANAPRLQIDNCTATGEDDSTGSVKLTSTAEYSKIVNCYFQSSNGATATPALEIAADYVKVTDSTLIAGTSAATGHGDRCFTFSGGADYPYVANTYIAKVHSFDGATRESACIYLQTGCHYGSISHNYLFPDGSVLSYATTGSADNGNDYWSVMGNVIRLGAGPCRGIHINRLNNCTIIGNVSNPAGSAVYTDGGAGGTGCEYGTSGTFPGANS